MLAYDWGCPYHSAAALGRSMDCSTACAARRRRVRPAQARRCRAQLKTWGCRPPAGRGVRHHNRGLGAAGRMADEVWAGNLKNEEKNGFC